MREKVLNGAELGVELGGGVGLGNGGVVVGEVVALEAERTDPNERLEVHPGVRVEHGGARLAAERRVLEREEVRVGSDQVDRSRDWDHALASLHLGARPGVPRHANSVDPLHVRLGNLRRSHLRR